MFNPENRKFVRVYSGEGTWHGRHYHMVKVPSAPTGVLIAYPIRMET